jgi:hypothetical protein
MLLHNQFEPEISPGEPIGTPPENPPASNPALTAEEKKEDQFEKTSVDSGNPYHLNVYIRTFLGAMILLGLIFFYIVHLTEHGNWGTYGQTPTPSDTNHLP